MKRAEKTLPNSLDNSKIETAIHNKYKLSEDRVVQRFHRKTKSTSIISDMREEYPAKKISTTTDMSDSQINFFANRPPINSSASLLQKVKIDDFLLSNLKKMEGSNTDIRSMNLLPNIEQRFSHLEPSPPSSPFGSNHKRSNSDFVLKSNTASRIINSKPTSTRPTTQQSTKDQNRFNFKRKSCGKIALFIKNGILVKEESEG